VPKHVESFEKDSYLHVMTHMKEDYLGTLSYFLLDVKNPAPELLLDDPEAYAAEIRHHGGLVAFNSVAFQLDKN
jgi:hypothetical protein